MQLNGTVEGNGHSYLLVGSVGQDFVDEDILELLGDLDQEGPIGSSGGFDGAGEICIRVSMLENDQIPEADWFALFPGLLETYAFI